MADQSQTPEATPRPWAAQSRDDGKTGAWWIDTHAYADGPEPVWAETYPVSEADVALIIKAVNAYDRLRRIEAAAQEFFRVYDQDAVYAANLAPVERAIRVALKEKP